VYPLRRLVVFARFLRAALRTKADVYHAHDLNTLLMAWVASRLRRVPLVYDTHEVATDRQGMKLRWWACLLERALIRRAARVICTNRTRADFTQRRYGLSPPTIVRNYPSYVEPRRSSLLHDALGLAHDTKIVLYQGGVQAARGLEQLLEAAPDIEGAVIIILGSGALAPALSRRVNEMGLEGKVLFHPAVPVEDLPNWTACADVGLQVLQNTCFNHYSSLSNKLLEYLMAGVPAVTSDLPEMRAVIEQTGAGLVVDASDPRQIAAAVNRLLADDGMRAEMSRRACETRRRYCWEGEQHVLTDLYAGLLDEAAGQRG
jgi:glycosyltransferase involved in cell wall biosynthesis